MAQAMAQAAGCGLAWCRRYSKRSRPRDAEVGAGLAELVAEDVSNEAGGDDARAGSGQLSLKGGVQEVKFESAGSSNVKLAQKWHKSMNPNSCCMRL